MKDHVSIKFKIDPKSKYSKEDLVNELKRVTRIISFMKDTEIFKKLESDESFECELDPWDLKK